MMEAFGVNLQRKNHYDNLHEQISILSTLTKTKGSETDKLIRETATKAGNAMRSIYSTSVADSVLLKNRHNELFLRLMEGLERDKSKQNSPKRKIADPSDSSDVPERAADDFVNTDENYLKFQKSITPKKINKHLVLPHISKSNEDLSQSMILHRSPPINIGSAVKIKDSWKSRNFFEQNTPQMELNRSNSPSILQYLQQQRSVKQCETDNGGAGTRMA